MTAKAASILVNWKLNAKNHTEPVARDEMDTAAFDAMMREGLEQAKAGQGLPLNEAFDILRRGL